MFENEVMIIVTREQLCNDKNISSKTLNCLYILMTKVVETEEVIYKMYYHDATS